MKQELRADRQEMLTVLKALSDTLDTTTKATPVTAPTLLFSGINFLKLILLNLYKAEPDSNWYAIAMETMPELLHDTEQNLKDHDPTIN